MTITWHPTAGGGYTIHRNHQPTPARIINSWAGWQTGVVHGQQWTAYGSPWTLASSVTAWLESDQGQTWLDSLEDR